jgi:hypothetical protein
LALASNGRLGGLSMLAAETLTAFQYLEIVSAVGLG